MMDEYSKLIGQYTPGVLAKEERAKLPTNAIAPTQQLALWLPADGRLLWQLGELAAVYGDYPDVAVVRMRWARSLVVRLYSRRAPARRPVRTVAARLHLAAA